jgi:hypothetical protein
MVDKYNVNFYYDEIHDGDRRWYLLIIDEFDGIEATARPVGKKTLYVRKENENTYGDMWQRLHDKDFIYKLITRLHNNSNIESWMIKGVLA